MALTFNGIAQGYIADKVAQLLRREGVTDVLVNTGEINALGVAPDGGAWPIKLADQTRGLTNAAIATSAPSGTFFLIKKAKSVIFLIRAPGCPAENGIRSA